MKNFLQINKRQSEVQRYIEENNGNPEKLKEDEAKKIELFKMIEHPRVLLTGMPDRQLNHFVGNIAQHPQGPMLKEHPWLPEGVKDFVDGQFKDMFNPNIATPYVGINLLKQNLDRDLPENYTVDLENHPTRKELLSKLERRYYPYIGLAVGGENVIPDAEKLVREIQDNYLVWAERIKRLVAKESWNPSAVFAYIQEMREKLPRQLLLQENVKFSSPKTFVMHELFKKFGDKLTGQIMLNPELLDFMMPMVICGNYGSTAAKKIYDSKEGERRERVLDTPGKFKTKILWQSVEDRAKTKLLKKEPYTGEGVHDIRTFFTQEMGIDLKRGPNDPITAKGVKEISLDSENFFLKFVRQQVGLSLISNEKFYNPGSIGCTNKCNFCCTAAQFEGNREMLFKSPDELADNLIQQTKEARQEWINSPGDRILTDEFTFWIQDENLTKTPDILEKLANRIRESKENIHWGASSDIDGLLKYLKKNGSFLELARGGFSVVWIGVESMVDFYEKRNGATVEEVENLFKELHRYGIVTIASYQNGLPIHTEGETVYDKDGKCNSLNIYDDINWTRKLNPSAHQYNIFTYFNLRKGLKRQYDVKTKVPGQDYDEASLELLGAHDDDIAHIAVSNVSQIPDNMKLEEINRMARETMYLENGPVTFRSLMTMWEGFMNLKDSDNDDDIRQATYRYWTVKNTMHAMTLGTPMFQGKIFKEMSKEFKERLAKCMWEAENFVPKMKLSDGSENRLNKSYQKAFDKYNHRMHPIVRLVSAKMRQRFIGLNLGKEIDFDQMTADIED